MNTIICHIFGYAKIYILIYIYLYTHTHTQLHHQDSSRHTMDATKAKYLYTHTHTYIYIYIFIVHFPNTIGWTTWETHVSSSAALLLIFDDAHARCLHKKYDSWRRCYSSYTLTSTYDLRLLQAVHSLLRNRSGYASKSPWNRLLLPSKGCNLCGFEPSQWLVSLLGTSYGSSCQHLVDRLVDPERIDGLLIRWAFVWALAAYTLKNAPKMLEGFCHLKQKLQACHPGDSRELT